MTHFVQPDPYSCVPISFAYYIYKLMDKNFDQINNKVLSLCKSNFNLSKNGMDFLDLKVIAKKMGYQVLISSTEPSVDIFITGVKQLPIIVKYDDKIVRQSIKVGSLEVTKDYYRYPEGHAVVVRKQDNKNFVFDSFFGQEIELSEEDLENCLEDKVEYFIVK